MELVIDRGCSCSMWNMKLSIIEGRCFFRRNGKSHIAGAVGGAEKA